MATKKARGDSTPGRAARAGKDSQGDGIITPHRGQVKPMSGDWIRIRTSLPDDLEILQIAKSTGLDPDTVLGKILRLWCWADPRVPADGNAVGVTKTWIDRYMMHDGFARAMVECGWLAEGPENVWFVRWDEYNSKSAKQRALAQRRVSKHRQKKRAERYIGNDASVTKALPEKRREEKRRGNPPDPPSEENRGNEETEAELRRHWPSPPLPALPQVVRPTDIDLVARRLAERPEFLAELPGLVTPPAKWLDGDLAWMTVRGLLGEDERFGKLLRGGYRHEPTDEDRVLEAIRRSDAETLAYQRGLRANADHEKSSNHLTQLRQQLRKHGE